MELISVLQSRSGARTSIHFDGGRLQTMVQEASADAYIVSCEDGLSPLGMNKAFASGALGIDDGTIGDLAYWNRYANDCVTLVSIPSRSEGSPLRGLIICPSEMSKCYRRFAEPFFGRPHRDFYYSVTYAAIEHAAEALGARRLAISHLTASGNFHEDVATCNAEALAHYCDSGASPIESFTFLGCCIGRVHLMEIKRLNAEGALTTHRPIKKEVEALPGHTLIHLDIGNRASPADAVQPMAN